MTKQELLADLEGKTFVDALIGEPVLQETKPGGDNWYVQNVREVDGNVAKYHNLNFYVVNEGEKGEVAYYKDKEPAKSIAITTTA